MKILGNLVPEHPTSELEEIVGKKRKNFSSKVIEFEGDELMLRKLKSLIPFESIKIL